VRRDHDQRVVTLAHDGLREHARDGCLALLRLAQDQRVVADGQRRERHRNHLAALDGLPDTCTCAARKRKCRCLHAARLIHRGRHRHEALIQALALLVGVLPDGQVPHRRQLADVEHWRVAKASA
jgi:hypothetical protein